MEGSTARAYAHHSTATTRIPMTEVSDPAREAWAFVLDELADELSASPQMGGFMTLVQPKGILAGTLYLEVPTTFVRMWLEERARTALLGAVGKLDPTFGIENFALTVNPDVAPNDTKQSEPEVEPLDSPRMPVADAVAPAAAPDDAAPARQTSNQSYHPSRPTTPKDAPNDDQLNAKYIFDNFVIGGSNRFAHAAAVAVAESPAKSYNPLFIYGGSGLGKTHLLHAIGHYAKSLYQGIRVKYVSSEEFTNDFINSIASNENAAFQARYRNIDILLIDDIQFLQGKDSTQEAFFHTFNTLHNHNKQVVITSDLPPKLLTGFEDRMRSRFEWGLITDVQAPDLETRIAILRKKSQADNIHIRDDVLEFIASKVTSNIRELEGTLIRVTAYANINKTDIDMDVAQTVLKDHISNDSDNVISPTDIVAHTANYFKISVDEIYGSSRSQAIATARQIAMYLCREMTSLSLPKIGQLFGGRDHTTVMYATKKVTRLMTERRSIFNQVSELTSRIRQGNAND